MNNLKKYRYNAMVSQIDLANQVGISKQMIYEIEIGKRKLSSKIAIKVADCLKVDPIELLGDEIFKIKPTTPYQKTLIRRLLKK